MIIKKKKIICIVIALRKAKMRGGCTIGLSEPFSGCILSGQRQAYNVLSVWVHKHPHRRKLVLTIFLKRRFKPATTGQDLFDELSGLPVAATLFGRNKKQTEG